jgi:V/A-type H+-transporting ATPase subunit D
MTSNLGKNIMRDITPTRSAYLELAEERVGMEEGFQFLDEKRLILAAEILQELEHYEVALASYQTAYQKAGELLKAAVARHGIRGLNHYPVKADNWSDISQTSRSVLGLTINTMNISETNDSDDPEALNPSPEAEQTKRAFKKLISNCVELAGMRANLFRLKDEYQRTSRRARALEDVILPEIDATLKHIDSTLEEMDKEEIVRMRFSLPSTS